MTEAHHHQSAPESPKPTDIMGTLEYYLVTKAPFQLPSNVREWLVAYLPWIDLLVLILLAPAILVALGVGATLVPLGAMVGAPAAGLSLVVVALAIRVTLSALALPGLFARKTLGWNLAFYGVIVSLIHDLMNFDVVGGLLSAVVSGYVLFQIRSYYK